MSISLSFEPKEGYERILIFSFAPANESAGVGGFTWSYIPEKVREQYEDAIATFGDTHVLRLVEAFVEPGIEDNDDITEKIDNYHLGDVELFLPAVDEYVPQGTEADRIPQPN